MRQVSPAAMKPGSEIERHDRIQEPAHGHGQREDSNAATPPSHGARSAVAAEGGAGASSPSPLPAAPVGRPQERLRVQAGGGSRRTHGSSSASAAAGVDQKGKWPADIPSLAPSPPRSAGSSPSTPSPDSALPSGDGTPYSAPVDCKQMFEELVREQTAIVEAGRRSSREEGKKKKPGEEQVKSSHAKKGLWSKFKNYFTRKKEIDDREGRQILGHVRHQTLPISKVGKYYRVTEDMPIRVNLDAYSRIRPVLGDGECFYRSFIFSYIEQVLDRQDTHEERRLLDTIKRVSTQHKNLGWTSEFCRSYNAFKKMIKEVIEWKRHGRWNSIAAISYRKEKLLEFFSAYDKTNDIFVFLRLVVAIEMCSHEEEYGLIIPGLRENYSLKDVIPARKFTDHIMMTALVRALEVPLRLERLFGGGSSEDNIYTGPGAVRVTLLYTGNHYDIIYPRAPSAESSNQQASSSQREHLPR